MRVWLIIETILCIPAVAFGAFAALMSPMMFDAPGSTSNPQVLLMFASVVGFPIACVAGVVLAWIAFAMKRNRVALWLSFLPVLPILSGCIAMLVF